MHSYPKYIAPNKMPFRSKEFDRVRTYQDLIAVNVAFLRGEIDHTPYHGGPIDRETVPLLGKLVQVNQFGFVTVCGQPAVDLESGFNEKTKKFWQVRQRPFLEGYLPKIFLPELLEFLHQQTDYVYNIWDLQWKTNGWWSRLFFQVPKHEVQSTLLETTMLDGWELTIGRATSMESQLEQMPWDIDTMYPPIQRYSPPFDFHGYVGVSNVLVPHCVLVSIAGKTFGQGSTEDLMLTFFKQYHSKLRKDSKLV